MMSVKSNGEEDLCYYIEIDENLGCFFSITSHFVGFADKDGRVELRAARKVYLEKLKEFHHESALGVLQIVQTQVEFYYFWINGGNAAVDVDLAEKLIPELLEAAPVVSTGFGPFKHLTTSLESATQRAPSRKMRMQILERDSFRCLACGQRPSEDPNVILNIHHIRPWTNYGATTPENLITLCQTCHLGLDPHYNKKMAALLDDHEMRLVGCRMPPKP